MKDARNIMDTARTYVVDTFGGFTPEGVPVVSTADFVKIMREKEKMKQPTISPGGEGVVLSPRKEAR